MRINKQYKFHVGRDSACNGPVPLRMLEVPNVSWALSEYHKCAIFFANLFLSNN